MGRIGYRERSADRDRLGPVPVLRRLVVRHVKVRTAPYVTEDRAPGHRDGHNVSPPGRLGRIAQVELVLHEEVRDGSGVVEQMLRSDVIVVVQVLRAALLQSRPVGLITAVVVKVKGTAGTADTASCSANDAVVMIVVVQTE